MKSEGGQSIFHLIYFLGGKTCVIVKENDKTVSMNMGVKCMKSVVTLTGSYRNDAKLQQITEPAQINSMDLNTLMNDRKEWNMMQISQIVVTAV